MAAMVTRVGTAIISAALNAYASAPKFVGWGTSNTAEAGTQTDLVTPGANEARTSGTTSVVTGTYTNDTFQVVALITCATGGKTIQEVGLFDAAGSGTPPSGGTLFARAVHGAQTLSVGDSIEYTIGVKSAPGS
jgi:hypothetical protein